MDDVAYRISDTYRTLFLCMILLLAGAGIVEAQTGAPPIEPDPIIQPHPCPEQSDRAERYLQHYLRLEYRKQQRQDLGIDHLDPENVSTITDEEVCGHIIHELRNNPMIQGNIDPDEWNRYFLQAGSYYLVEYLWEPDTPEGTISYTTGHGARHIFRHDFTVLYSWAPNSWQDN